MSATSGSRPPLLIADTITSPTPARMLSSALARIRSSLTRSTALHQRPHAADQDHQAVGYLAAAGGGSRSAMLIEPGWPLDEWHIDHFPLGPLVLNTLPPVDQDLMQQRQLKLDDRPEQASLKAIT